MSPRPWLFILAFCVACSGAEVEFASGGGGAATTSNGGATSAQGGNAGAGAVGSGGEPAGGSGVGGTGAGSTVAECTSSDQCTLHNDCCSCIGIAPGETPPDCSDISCLISTCESLGHDGLTPSCEAGRCVAGFPCDTTPVTCEQAPPACQPGHTPSVDGDCYGPCVAANECATVTNCQDCNAAGHACVVENTQLGPRYHCVTVPTSCMGDVTCNCLGSSVCVAPYDQCVEQNGALNCNCINC